MKKLLLLIMLVSGVFGSVNWEKFELIINKAVEEASMATDRELFGDGWQNAKIVRVVDGDTLILKQDNKKRFKVRLIALDTFETKFNHRVFKQMEILKNIHPNGPKHKDKYIYTVKKVLSLGFKAKEFVSKRYKNKIIRFHSYGVDKYGRTLVWIDGLNFALVRMGWATYYPNNQISKQRKAYLLDLSRDANINHRGIFKRL